MLNHMPIEHVTGFPVIKEAVFRYSKWRWWHRFSKVKMAEWEVAKWGIIIKNVQAGNKDYSIDDKYKTITFSLEN
jgi:hypothetical protein